MHAAALTDDPTWGICGVGLVDQDRELHDRLREQDYL